MNNQVNTPILEELTPEQLDTVEHFGSPELIVAGPGSGKTKSLTRKVKYLIEEKGIHPSEIVLTTFTVKAAEDLRKKIQKTMPSLDTSSMFIGTIHSYCDNIIKQYGGIKISWTNFISLSN